MEDYIEVRMPSGNPWIKGPLVKVNRAQATHIADVAAEVAESFRGKFKTAYRYDEPVFGAVFEMSLKTLTKWKQCFELWRRFSARMQTIQIGTMEGTLLIVASRHETLMLLLDLLKQNDILRCEERNC